MKEIISSTIVFALITLILSVVGLAGYLEHYTEQDGVGVDCVSAICIDQFGVKWLAGRASKYVSRFDENNWEGYPISGSGVVDMALDDAGRPWVVTGGCIGYLWKGVFQRLNYPLLSAYSAVAWSPDGALWTGGWVGELEVWRSFDPLSASQWKCWKGLIPWKFAIDADGRVWCVGATCSIGGSYYEVGVCRISADGESWDRIDDNVRLPTGIRYQQVCASPDGRVWVQGFSDEAPPDCRCLPPFYSDDYESWFKFDESPFSAGNPSADYPLYINSVTKGGIWFVSSGAAVYYDYQDWRFIRVPSNVNVIQVDERTDDVWFGTNDGVYVMRGGPEAWPPVWIELEAGVDEAGGAEAFSLFGSAEFQMDLNLDLYVAVQLPSGDLLFAPDWSPTMSPLVPGLEVPIGLNIEDMPLVTVDTAGMPAGMYRWFAACTHAGSMDFASNIASCEWQFE